MNKQYIRKDTKMMKSSLNYLTEVGDKDFCSKNRDDKLVHSLHEQELKEKKWSYLNRDKKKRRKIQGVDLVILYITSRNRNLREDNNFCFPMSYSPHSYLLSFA